MDFTATLLINMIFNNSLLQDVTSDVSEIMNVK